MVSEQKRRQYSCDAQGRGDPTPARARIDYCQVTAERAGDSVAPLAVIDIWDVRIIKL